MKKTLNRLRAIMPFAPVVSCMFLFSFSLSVCVCDCFVFVSKTREREREMEEIKYIYIYKSKINTSGCATSFRTPSFIY